MTSDALILAVCTLVFSVGMVLDARGAVNAAFRAVMCPPDWKATVSQRYDTRDRWDWIIDRTWITRCY